MKKSQKLPNLTFKMAAIFFFKNENLNIFVSLKYLPKDT